VVGVAVAFGVRDERDVLESSALEAAGDEGVRDAGGVGDAEVEVDAAEAFGGAVLLGIGACASHAKLRGGGAFGVVTLNGESDRVTAHVVMASPPMGSHSHRVALADAAAGKG
jgi:hypothetical protein